MFKVFKNIQKPQLNKHKQTGLHEAGFLIFVALAVLSLLALMTYHPADPGFFHAKQTAFVNNLAGKPGAWFADTFLNLFGYLAYAIPIVLGAIGWMIYDAGSPKNQVKRGGANAWVSFLGFVMIVVAGCGLATLHIDAGNLPTYTAGGGGYIGLLVGYILGSSLGSSLILVAILLAGFTLLTDISWFTIMDKIGDMALKMFDMLTGSVSQGMSKSKAPVSKAMSMTGGMLKSGLNHLPGTVNKALKASGLTATTKTADGETKIKSQSPKINLESMGNLGKVVKNKASIKIGGASAASGVSLEATDDAAKARIEGDSSSENKTQKAAAVADDNSQAAPSRIEPTLGLNDDALDNKDKPEYATGSTLIDPLVASTDDLLAPLDTEAEKKPAKPSLPPLPIELLNHAPESQGQYTQEQLDSVADKIVKILSDYGVNATVEDNFPGPVITRFELGLAAGTKVSKVVGLVKDIARELGVASVRVVEVIPGKSTIGLEVPNQKRDLVAMRDIVESKAYQNSQSALTLVLGKDISGEPSVANLGKMPHLLVAGTTGSGKSVAVNAMLVSLLYKSNPEDVRMILIDPKMLELSVYEGIPHLLAPVVTDMKDASNALRWCVAEMERRYLLMSKLSVRNLAGYNVKVKEAQAAGQPLSDPLDEDGVKTLDTMPNIVVVVDEFADMMMVVGKKVEELIARLAQKARAAGIHLILATQRPSVDVITGLIKANIPSRIAFQVSTKVDSRTILDQVGAEQLLGMGDMLYLPPGTALPKRVHGAFVSDKEVIEIAAFLKKHGEPDYLAEVLEEPVGNGDAIPGLEPLENDANESDPLYDEAVAIVTESRRASISYLQRRLKVGYNRAARMIEDMEVAGVVSAVQSNGTREVLAPPPVALT